MSLLNDKDLERSSIVANSMMNRERGINGGNSYQQELGFDPIGFLQQRLNNVATLNNIATLSWLDLCCGSGRALIEAAVTHQPLAGRIEIQGIDLVNFFYAYPKDLTGLSLTAISINDWQPRHNYDLITCVHGLHYLGDKLKIITSMIEALKFDGRFIANLDLNNFKYANGENAGRQIVAALRKAGCNYDNRKHILSCHGRRSISLPFHYLGASDQAGANYTKQPAVDSYYQR